MNKEIWIQRTSHNTQKLLLGIVLLFYSNHDTFQSEISNYCCFSFRSADVKTKFSEMFIAFLATKRPALNLMTELWNEKKALKILSSSKSWKLMFLDYTSPVLKHLVSCGTSVATWSSVQVQWTDPAKKFSAKAWSLARDIPKIHSNFNCILIFGIINSTLLNSVGRKQQQPAADGGSTSNPTIMDVSWYIIVHTSSPQGHSTPAPLWAWPSSKRLSALKIPWFAVTNKVSKFLQTSGPGKILVPGAATSDFNVVPVLVHLLHQPVGDVWSTPVINEEWLLLKKLDY